MIERRTFGQIRNALIRELARGERNLNELAKAAKVSWRTAENHIIFLIGRGYAIKIVDSPYVKIFKITDEGKKIRRTKARL